MRFMLFFFIILIGCGETNSKSDKQVDANKEEFPFYLKETQFGPVAENFEKGVDDFKILWEEEYSTQIKAYRLKWHLDDLAERSSYYADSSLTSQIWTDIIILGLDIYFQLTDYSFFTDELVLKEVWLSVNQSSITYKKIQITFGENSSEAQEFFELFEASNVEYFECVETTEKDYERAKCHIEKSRKETDLVDRFLDQ